jgi:hypothetical protein
MIRVITDDFGSAKSQSPPIERIDFSEYFRRGPWLGEAG